MRAAKLSRVLLLASQWRAQRSIIWALRANRAPVDVFRGSFRPRSLATTPSSDEVGRLLALGNAGDSRSRAEFYSALLSSKVFLLSGDSAGPVGPEVAKGRETISFQTIADESGKPYIAVFSSIAKLEAVRVGRWVSLTGKDLLLATKGAHLVVNPGSPDIKVLIPEEVEQILDGRIFADSGVRETDIPKGASLRMGSAAGVPADFVAALSRACQEAGYVQAAYLAAMQIDGLGSAPVATSGPQTGVIVGIVQSGDLRALLARMTKALEGVVSDSVPVDFVELPADAAAVSAGSVQHYLLHETQPFFVQR